MEEEKFVSFTYMNHNGKQEYRTIIFGEIEFCHAPSFGYQPGWFVSGICQNKQARRSFALNRIVFGEPSTKGLSRNYILFSKKDI